MKSVVVESDRVKIEGRQSLPRRKMPKNSPVVNGASVESVVGYEDSNLVIRQVNLAAAYHDHISCTKSADLCKIPDTKESRVNLPCETDHIYANFNEKPTKSHGMVTGPSKDRNDDKRHLNEMCLLQLELIKHLEAENAAKDKRIQSLLQEIETLKVRQERMERRVHLNNKSIKSDAESDGVSDSGQATSNSQVLQRTTHSENETSTLRNQNSAVHLVTRYFGRRSKTIPSRALKRRYFGPPKTIPCKKASVNNVPTTSATSLSSSSVEETSQEEKLANKVKDSSRSTLPITEPLPEGRKRYRRRTRERSKVIPKIENFLTTDKEYFLPDYYSQSSLDDPENIDVPSWRYSPVASFYQMEGTENIDDKVFQRRHLKCEQDEKRRKRWDIQRLREQKASEKLKYKQDGGNKTSDGLLKKKNLSLYPNPNKFEFIEVTEKLPVLAFGRPIPLFQPSEFSLPWKFSDFREPDKGKKSSSTTRVT